MKPSVFVSYQMEDARVRHLLVNLFRRRSRSFELIDFPAADPFDQFWKDKCREWIQQTSGTIVLVGSTTHKSEPVRWEIQETRRQGHPVLGVLVDDALDPQLPAGLDTDAVIGFDVDQLLDRLEEWIRE